MGNLRHSDDTAATAIVMRHRFHAGSVELKYPRRLTEEEFYEFCADNRDLRIEQDKNGNILIMPPVDHDSGVAESNVHGYLFSWWLTYQQGLTYSPTTGFKLPDGATRSADSAWASDEKVANLTPQQRKQFAPLVPDFVVEVRSTSDQIGKLKKKMTDTWMANGVRLAWLIDPKMQRAYIYRPDQPVEECLGFDRKLSGEEVCPGFELDLRKLR